MKTVLEICQEVARQFEFDEPTDLFSPKDEEWRLGLNRNLKLIHDLRFWQNNIKEGALPIEDFENLGSKICGCLLYKSPIYFFDKEHRVIKSVIYNKSYDELLKEPIPKDAIMVKFQYVSDSIVWDFNTFEEKPMITENTDVPIYDEKLVKLLTIKHFLNNNIDELVKREIEKAKLNEY